MTTHTIAIIAHLLAATLWVGGMFFAYQILRPVAATQLEPPERLRLWAAVFSRFFPWVWLFVLLLPLTGYWLMFGVYGGFAGAGLHIHLMHGLGWVMVLIYMHVYFAPFRRMKEAVITEQWPIAAKQLDKIRFIIRINMLLGILIIGIAAGGRF